MSAPAAAPRLCNTSAHGLIAEARRLVPFLPGQADAIEAGRRLTPLVDAALREAGFSKLITPPALGGASVTLAKAMRVLEQFALGDATSAWCAWASCAAPAMAAFLDEEGARELFAAPETVVATSVAAARGADAAALPQRR